MELCGRRASLNSHSTCLLPSPTLRSTTNVLEENSAASTSFNSTSAEKSKNLKCCKYQNVQNTQKLNSDLIGVSLSPLVKSSSEEGSTLTASKRTSDNEKG